MNPSRTRVGILAALMAGIGLLVPATANAHASVRTLKTRRNGRGKAGAYGRGLQNAWNRKRLQQQKKLNHLRDENGAFTLIGRGPGHCAAWDETGALSNPGRIFPVGCGEVRRVWLAGISAIRGY